MKCWFNLCCIHDKNCDSFHYVKIIDIIIYISIVKILEPFIVMLEGGFLSLKLAGYCVHTVLQCTLERERERRVNRHTHTTTSSTDDREIWPDQSNTLGQLKHRQRRTDWHNRHHQPRCWFQPYILIELT